MPVIKKLFQAFFGEPFNIRNLVQLFDNVMNGFLDFFYRIISKCPGKLFQGIFLLSRKKCDAAAEKFSLVFFWNIQFIRSLNSGIV